MRNLIVLIALFFCVVTVSFAADTPADSGFGGMTIGGHDIFLSEAPTTYRQGVLRMAGMWTRDDLSYVRYGFLGPGPADLGVSFGAGVGRTAVLYDFAEIGFRVGADLDGWLDRSIVAVPHAKLQLKSLWSNPTSLYATVAGGFPWHVSVNQTDIQPSRLYAFVGINQRVGPFDLDVAVGNRNTVRVGIAIKRVSLPCTTGLGSLGWQILRSPDQESFAIFLTSDG